MLNRAILMGRLCDDPEFRQTQSNIPVCRIRIAINRPKQKDGTQEADFINCTAWRSTAEFISRYFSKGNMILVEGELRNDNYTDNNGTKHYGINVQIDSVSFCESKNSDGAAQGEQGQYQQAPPPQQYQQYQAPPPQYQAPPQQYQAAPPPPQYGAVPAPNYNPYHPN